MTNKTLRFGFNLSVALSMLVVLAFGLINHRRNGELQEQIVNLRAEMERSPRLSGFQVDIPAYSELVEEWEGMRKGAEAGRRLVIAMSDDSPYCQTAVTGWERLISTAQWMEEDAIWLVSFKGTELSRRLSGALRRTEVPYRMYEVVKAAAFTVRSGIDSVPLTMLLGQDNRPEAVSLGELGDREIEFFRRAIANRSVVESIPFLTSKAATGLTQVGSESTSKPSSPFDGG